MLFSDLFNVAAIGGKSPRDCNCLTTLTGPGARVKRVNGKAVLGRQSVEAESILTHP